MADFFTKPSFNVWDVIGGGLNLYGAYKSAEAKEDAADYRFSREPDIPWLDISELIDDLYCPFNIK